MFIHNLIYNTKILLRSKSLIFWTFAFPLLLATFFYMAFKDIEKNESFDVFDVAVVENNDYKNDKILISTLDELSRKDNKDRLFNIKYTTKKQASAMLDNKKIVSYLEVIDNKPNIYIKQNGVNETIFKFVIEEIFTKKNQIESITTKKINDEIKLGKSINTKKIINDTNKIIKNEKSNIKDISGSNLSYTMIEFYTLIAMTCMYGGILGMFTINNSLANMTTTGKRIEMSPIKKRIIILSATLSSYIVQLVGLLILYLYTIFILNVDYGNLLLVIPLSLLGSLAGLSLGIFVSSLIKKDDNIKTGIIISISMLGSFFSGMMGITMKYVIDKNIPIINKINPVNMITDGLYSIYYYNTLDRYIFNIISLLIFITIMLTISGISLRRKQYDNI